MHPKPEPPRAGLHQGEQNFRAVPLHMDGNAASLVVGGMPSDRHSARLILDWEGGSTTELDVRIMYMDRPSRLAHVEIRGIDGDWGSFLAYVGRQEE